jgi:NAD(P)-dependent dehydrogenase (short-subunit alcohol dehydrogenase family)
MPSVITADLTDMSQAVRVVEGAVAEHGRLDILVSNACGAMPASYLDTTPDTLDEAFLMAVTDAASGHNLGCQVKAAGESGRRRDQLIG